jgi:hypothetical protein
MELRKRSHQTSIFPQRIRGFLTEGKILGQLEWTKVRVVENCDVAFQLLRLKRQATLAQLVERLIRNQ